MNKILFTGAAVLVAALSLGVSAPAFAEADLVVDYHPQDGVVTRTKVVQIADLNLASRDGRRALETRVIRAARQVCDYNGLYGINQPSGYDVCYDKAKGDALRSVVIQTASR